MEEAMFCIKLCAFIEYGYIPGSGLRVPPPLMGHYQAWIHILVLQTAS